MVTDGKNCARSNLSFKTTGICLSGTFYRSKQDENFIAPFNPNTMGAIVVTMTLAIPDAIFTEAFLSFIGLGVSAPMASWGVLASEGINNIRAYPFHYSFLRQQSVLQC